MLRRDGLRLRAPRPRRRVAAAGFTLLEVLVALAILGVAVVTLIELSSRSLRLVKTSGDYQQAVLLANRVATESQPTEEGSDAGQEGQYQWQRQVTLVPVPDDLEPKQTIPGKEAAKLYAVTISVRWGGGQVVELATMRTPTSPPAVTGTQPTTTTGTQQSPAGAGGGQSSVTSPTGAGGGQSPVTAPFSPQSGGARGLGGLRSR